MRVKIPFGYKNFTIGKYTVYTGKIRVRQDEQTVSDKLKEYNEHLQFTETTSKDWLDKCTTITFNTDSPQLNFLLINAINTVLAEIMHKRIDEKYFKYSKTI